MTAFAASIFAFALLASSWIIATSLRSYGRSALELRKMLANCPGSLCVTWKVIERSPAQDKVRTDRVVVLGKRPQAHAPRLEWPSLDLAA